VTNCILRRIRKKTCGEKAGVVLHGQGRGKFFRKATEATNRRVRRGICEFDLRGWGVRPNA